jgi:Mor family transcriptional regulator
MTARPCKNTERDAQIVQAYIAGVTLKELAAAHCLTVARIYQITMKAGVFKRERLSRGLAQ